MKRKTLIPIGISICMLLMTLQSFVVADPSELPIDDYYDYIYVDWHMLAHENPHVFGFNNPQPDYNQDMNAKAGESLSEDGIAICMAEPYVHTYNGNLGPGLNFMFIFNEMSASESRPEHKPYIAIPTIDLFRNLEWVEGPTLGGLFVPENKTFDLMNIGVYGIGKCFDQDLFIPFRIFMRIYVQSDEQDNKFDLDNVDTDGGIWYYDVPPIPQIKEEKIIGGVTESINMSGSDDGVIISC